MPAPRVLPDKDELRRMVARGMTQQEIADEVFKRTGIKVTRNAISVAWRRAGFDPLRPRYEDLIPWSVKPTHGRHYALRMLRAEARLREGDPLDEMTDRRLKAWKEQMDLLGTVVHYEPETIEGFFYVPRRRGVDGDLIRKPGRAA